MDDANQDNDSQDNDSLNNDSLNKWEYLGDGVYAGFDGFQIWLHVGSHNNPTDKVALEPAVFDRLMGYAGKVLR